MMLFAASRSFQSGFTEAITSWEGSLEVKKPLVEGDTMWVFLETRPQFSVSVTK